MDRILDVALELMTREGYAALSMRKVADRLNMRLSAVQHHFPAWEDLFKAMMARVRADYVRVFEQHVQEPKGSRLKQFEHVLDYLLRDVKNPVSQSLFAQLGALAQTSEYTRQIMAEMYAYECRAFEFFVSELNPALDKKETARRAALMVAQIEGLMLLIPQQSRFPAPLIGIEHDCIERVIALALAPPSPKGRR